MAVRSLGVVCWAGLMYREHCPAVLLPKLFGRVRVAIRGQERLRVPCQRGSSAFLGAWPQQACFQGLLWWRIPCERSLGVPPASPHF